jgi:hypothetical protein
VHFENGGKFSLAHGGFPRQRVQVELPGKMLLGIAYSVCDSLSVVFVERGGGGYEITRSQSSCVLVFGIRFQAWRTVP